MWPEVKTAKEENRRELKLSGAGARKRFEDNGGKLDEAIFQLGALNLLDINDTPLDVISPKISGLKNLQSLLLFRNRIERIPGEIGLLSSLKVLDLSGNRIEVVPGEIGQLKALTTVNLSGNLLKDVDLSALENLIVCNLSSNKLEQFPALPVSGLEVQHLSEINLEKNLITEIPSSLAKQNGLKLLNVAENKIELVPKFLVKCPRLKEINLKENPLKDKRLKKLVEQCRSKQVLDYVEKNGHVAAANSESDKNSTQEAAEEEESNGPTEIRPKITVLTPPESARRISFTPEAKELRPHVLHCIVRDFTITSMKKFLQLQNDLHDNECGRRELATIATHDLAKISGDLRYQADLSESIEITPLNGKSKITAAKYYDDLRQQAETIRKEKKRNTYSGVHKFINLLKGEVFVFFADSTGKVISLPPLTNCDETKVGPETRHLLVEVTSSVSAESCRKVMLALLKGLLLLDVTVSRVAPEGKKKGKGKGAASATRVVYDKSAELSVEQVRLFDGDGNFHSVFPGKGELEFGEDENIDVEFGGC